MIKFTLYLEVNDPDMFRKHAKQRAEEEGDREFDASSLADCAQMLLDPGHIPGASIFESEVE